MKQVNIREHWWLIQPMLEKLYQREVLRGSPDWLPEDVYAACMFNQAWCYEVDQGYVILSEDDIPHTKGKALTVWFALAIHCSESSAIIDNMQSFLALAKQAGSKRIEFYSSRPGFSRIADKLGFQYQYSKYIRKV